MGRQDRHGLADGNRLGRVHPPWPMEPSAPVGSETGVQLRVPSPARAGATPEASVGAGTSATPDRRRPA